MSTSTKFMTLAGALILGGIAGTGAFRPVAAREGPNPVKSARGGQLSKSKEHQFEVFFYRTGLRVFPQSAAGAPVAVSNLTGTVTFTLPGAPRPFVYPIKGSAAAGGREPESVDLVIDLSKVPAVGSQAAFTIAGLGDPSESTASFVVPFEMVPTPVPVVMTHPAPVVVTQPAPVVVTQPTPAPSYYPAAPTPRYTYGQGYYGQGYYQQSQHAAPYAAPPSRPVYTVPSYSGSYSGGGGRSTRDWSTGRDTPIAKPWLRPGD